eukprot:4887356-Pyramimonas_sp.AAC.1
MAWFCPEAKAGEVIHALKETVSSEGGRRRKRREDTGERCDFRQYAKDAALLAPRRRCAGKHLNLLAASARIERCLARQPT